MGELARGGFVTVTVGVNESEVTRDMQQATCDASQNICDTLDMTPDTKHTLKKKKAIKYSYKFKNVGIGGNIDTNTLRDSTSLECRIFTFNLNI